MQNAAILTCDPQHQTLHDPYGAFPLAGCITQRATLTVDEAFLLMGRTMLEKAGEYDALYLQDSTEQLWEIFQKYSMQMEGLIDFLRAAGHAAEQYGRKPVHLLRPMCCVPEDSQAVTMVWRDPADAALYVNAKATGSGEGLRIRLKDKTTAEIPRALFRAFLHDLEARHLIEQLVWTERGEGAEWAFFYANGPVRNTLHTKGSCLEHYVWLHMVRSGCFDDVRSNCFYQWGSEAVSNELDVVATRGLQLFFCSCKTSMPGSGHLNEVQSLKSTLGLAAKSGMVYAFAPENRRQAEKYPAVCRRACEMGLPICNAMDDGAVDRLIEALLKP